MKTQITKQHTNAVAVQLATLGHKQHTQRFNLTKLMLLAVAIIAMALPSMAAVCNSTECIDQVGRLYVSPTSWAGFADKPVVYVSVENEGDMQWLSCTRLSGVYMTLQPDHPGYNQIYALLLASKTSGKVVKIRINTGSNNCSINYVVTQP